ncbi:MAG: 4Fe-4S binding protein [Candidatus Dactylopiibacterium sp.]|nr:4Fe-4S binding protein [Candidatus Dactylopiibacterium sp.]
MALAITEDCVRCWACLPLCPNEAISAGAAGFDIDPQRCTECVGDFAAPQCGEICPAEGALVDAWGHALNPPGSLGGAPVAAAAPAPGPRPGC